MAPRKPAKKIIGTINGAGALNYVGRCLLCSKLFPSDHDLAEHEQIEHATDEILYICGARDCRLVFLNLQKLTAHVRSHGIISGTEEEIAEQAEMNRALSMRRHTGTVDALLSKYCQKECSVRLKKLDTSCLVTTKSKMKKIR